MFIKQRKSRNLLIYQRLVSSERVLVLIGALCLQVSCEVLKFLNNSPAIHIVATIKRNDECAYTLNFPNTYLHWNLNHSDQIVDLIRLFNTYLQCNLLNLLFSNG